jgi:flagellar biosynthesis protein FlhF
MTDVRTFRAANMQAALDLVREEMGGEAVILHTRQTSKRRLLPWRKPVEAVEITAGLGVNVQHRATKMTVGGGVATASPATQQSPSINTKRLDGNSSHDGVMLEISSASRAIQRPLIDSSLRQGIQPANRAAQPASSPDPTAQFAEKLESIQKMLNELGRSSTLRKADEIPGELFSLYTELIDADVEDDVARGLIGQLKEHGSPKQLGDVNAARSLLTALVESEIRCSDPIVATPGKQKVVALVGTTGVGKTTTIAKLAANFRLRDGMKMGLVTVDTYRIAAVEQLRTYAEIIDLPMKVVTSPPEMRRAIDELAGLDLILIDTAGRSPRDDLQIRELKSLLAEANVDEVHLVLSLTSSVRNLLATAERFGVANATSLILTKLDEAAGLGSLLSLVRQVDLPISYITTGQDVPDDIEPARAARLARLVLGQDRLFG